MKKVLIAIAILIAGFVAYITYIKMERLRVLRIVLDKYGDLPGVFTKTTAELKEILASGGDK
jgi:hypothetical protein